MEQPTRLNEKDLSEEDFYPLAVEGTSTVTTAVATPALPASDLITLAFNAVAEGDKELLTLLLADDVVFQSRVQPKFYQELQKNHDEEQYYNRVIEILRAQAEILGNYYMHVTDLSQTNVALKAAMQKARKGLEDFYREQIEARTSFVQNGELREQTAQTRQDLLKEYQALIDKELALYTAPRLLNDEQAAEMVQKMRHLYQQTEQEHAYFAKKKLPNMKLEQDIKNEMEVQRPLSAEKHLAAHAQDKDYFLVGTEGLKRLLNANLPITIRHPTTEDSLLHYAIRYHQTAILEMLLACGADTQAVNAQQRSVIQEIGSSANLEALEVFIREGIDIEAAIAQTDTEGNTLLHHAIPNPKYHYLLGLLLEKGANLWTTNAAGKTPWELLDLFPYKNHQQRQQLRDTLIAVMLSASTPAAIPTSAITGSRQQHEAAEDAGEATNSATSPLLNENYAADWTRAQQYLANQQAEKALPLLSKLVAIFPNKIAYVVARGKCLAITGERQAALKDFDRALSMAQRKYKVTALIQIYWERGFTQENLQHFDAAIADYREVLALEATHFRARLQRASLYYRLGKVLLAEQDYQKLQEHHPHNPEMYKQWGEDLLNREEYAKANLAFNQALALKPNWAEVQAMQHEAEEWLRKHPEQQIEVTQQRCLLS